MSGYDFLGPYTPDEGVFDDEGLGPYGMPGADPDEDFSDVSGPVAGPNYLLGSGLSIDEGSQDYLDDDVPWGSGVHLSSDYDEEGLHDFEFDDDDDYDDDDSYGWFMQGDVFGRTSNIPSTLKGGADVRKYLHYLVESAKNKLTQAGYPGMSGALNAPRLHGIIDNLDPPGPNWTVEGGTETAQMFRPIFLKAMVDAGMSHEWRTGYLNTMGGAVSSQVPKNAPSVPKKQVSAASSQPEAVVTTIVEPEKASGMLPTGVSAPGQEPVITSTPTRRKPVPTPAAAPRVTTTTVTAPSGATTTTQTVEPSPLVAAAAVSPGILLGIAGVALIGVGLWGARQ